LTRLCSLLTEYMQELPESAKQMVGSVYATLMKEEDLREVSEHLLSNATNREEPSSVSC
jgi:hypothetical protein